MNIVWKSPGTHITVIMIKQLWHLLSIHSVLGIGPCKTHVLINLLILPTKNKAHRGQVR